MKAFIGGATLTLALLLAGCNGEGGDSNPPAAGNGTAPASTAPLKQVEAPNGDWTQVVTQTQEGGFLMGNPNAPVKLVEYASLTCPACAAFSQQSSEKLKNEYVKSGQVSFEFRNYVRDPLDLSASMLVRCQGTGPFFKSVEQLFAAQQQWMSGAQNISPDEEQRISQLPRDQQPGAFAKAAKIDTFFRQRGMPEARVNSCLADQKSVEQIVAANKTAVERDQLGGTPHFLINGTPVPAGPPGATAWESLEPQLRKAIG
jgi:protein-disulfide isomerase